MGAEKKREMLFYKVKEKKKVATQRVKYCATGGLEQAARQGLDRT
jgi:hypothetical protein